MKQACEPLEGWHSMKLFSEPYIKKLIVAQLDIVSCR
jgi:hypothetical protein